MKRNRLWLAWSVVAVFVAFGFSSCGGDYSPKPRGYFRIDLPKKVYAKFDSVGFPYSFEYPTYVKILPDMEKHVEPYWINLSFKGYNAMLHISYKKVQGNLPALLEDAHTFVYKHTIKADAILETAYGNSERRVYGTVYDIEGNAASALQFYLTDSTKNFLRGALYFYNRPNKDSLAPVVKYFREDVIRMIDTFSWK